MRPDEAGRLRNRLLAEACARENVQRLASAPLEITLTTLLKCNYRCRMCYQPGYEGELDWAVVERIEPLLAYAHTLQLFGGEPFLYPRMAELCRLAQRHGCAVSTVSNGSLLSESVCREIVDNGVGYVKFSIDAGTPATYRRIRGGDFAKVMAGVGRLAGLKASKRRRLPEIDFNFLAFRSNLPELPRLVRIAASLGVRAINVFYPSIHKEELAEDCVFFDQQRSDELLLAAMAEAARVGVGLNPPVLFRDAAAPGFREEIVDKAPCLDPWTKLMVGVDGEASLCCAGPTGIGNLRDAAFEDIWNGRRACGFRRTVNTPQAPAFCRVCGIRQGSPREASFHLKTPELLEKFARQA